MWREEGKNALRVKLHKEENITVFENYIHKIYGENENCYKDTMYQVVNDLTPQNMSEILSDIKEGRYGWNHKSLSVYRDIEYEQDAFIIQPFEIIEGIVDCKCGSKRVYSFSKQTRSGDESITTFNECLMCKSKWVYSG
jgi:DNA-directed RNA polymerase subunit M/transcription elongation factor TFIIS